MPRIKGIRAHLRVLFNRPSSSSDVADDDEPEIPPQAHPTIEEAKATAKEHSRAFKAMVATFEGFTALAKLVGPFLEGTPFKAPVSVFTVIAEGVEKLKDTRESAEDAMDSLSARMRDVAQHYGESRSAESRSMLQDYSKELVHAAQKINAILKLSWLGQLKVDANKSKLKGVIDQIDKSTSRLQLRVVLAIERDTKDILDALFKNNLRALNCAPSALYKADVVEGQSKREACTEGTRADILSRITAWASDPSSPSIFWLSGMAGSGKSTIAYTVCQYFSQGDTLSKAALGASFFCSRQVPELRRLGNIVPTLAYQLSHHSRSFATALKDVDLDVVHVSGEQVVKLLLAPWAASDSKRSANLPLTLIVIDALDEIDEDKGAELLQGLIDVTTKLQQGQESTRKLKILVTSRPHPHIVDAGVHLGPEAMYRLENIARSDGRADVLTFLRAKLHDLTREHDVLLEALADRADGLFIYAATVARILSSNDPAEAMTRNEKVDWLVNFVGNQQASFAFELGQLYGLYKGILHKSMSGHMRQRRLPILHRIVCTRQPLSCDALARILDLNSDQEMNSDAPVTLVKALHAILYVSETDGCVYAYHKSFLDFMLDSELSGHDIACDIDAQEAGIARACLRVMQESLRFNICDLPSSYLFDSEVPDLAVSIKLNIVDVHALEYACRYWVAHLIKVPTSSASAQLLCERLLEFMDEKVLFWLEVTNLRKETLDIIDKVKSVSVWVNAQQGASSTLKSTLMIVERLAAAFFWTKASASTPHLYISCLATLFGISHDLPDTWMTHFAKVPQIRCTGGQSQGRLLTKIHVRSRVLSVAFSPDNTRIVSGSDDGYVRIWDASTGEGLQTLYRNTSDVNSVAFSPDGTRIVSGSEDGSLRIWDVSTGVELQKIEGHTSDVRFVAFSPDSTRIISGSYDESVCIWDASSGVELQRLNGHTNGVLSVAFSPDDMRIVSGSDDYPGSDDYSGSIDQSVRIWDTSTGSELQRLDGHTSNICSVAFSPDGMRIVSGSYDNSVRIWDASTGKEIQKLDGHGGHVWSVAFSLDGTRIVSGSGDKSVRIWDASTGAELQKLGEHTNVVCCVAFSPDGTHIVSGCTDGSGHIWDTSTGTRLQVLDGHAYDLNSVAFSPDGTRIVSGSGDGSVRIWDASTGAELQKLGGHTLQVSSVMFSSDGTRIVSGSDDHSVHIWDASTGVELQKLDGHTGRVTSVDFFSDGARIVSGSYDNSVRIWDASTGAELHKLNGHTSGVRSVAFSPDGTRIVSGSDDGSVRIWDAFTGAELLELSGHILHVYSVAFSPDGTRIVSGSLKQSVHIWDASTGAEIQRLNGHTSAVNSVAFSPDGTRIVSGSWDHSVRIWDASTTTELQKLEGHSGNVCSVAFSLDGTRIVSGSEDYSVHIWDASTGTKLQKLDGHPRCVNSVAFSPDGTRIASGSGDESVRIWDASSGAELQKLVGHTGDVESVAFSLDGTRIASGSSDKSVRIWDASTGAKLQKLDGHTVYVNSVAFSPDGMRIVSSSGDKSVRIWAASIGAEIQRLNGHTSAVNSVAFSPDGTCIASSSLDYSVRIWDASTGAELRKLDGHENYAWSVAFSPDGTRIVSTSDDKSVRIWDATTGAELRKLEHEGHERRINCAVFSPDGTRIVSGSEDHSMRIWDASTGEELQKLDGHTSGVRSVVFSPDGTRIVSGSHDKSIRIWNTIVAHEHKTNQWRLDTKTEWIVSASSGARLLSVSPDLHVGLYDGKVCTLVIHQNGRTRVDFSNACIGPEWSKCYL